MDVNNAIADESTEIREWFAMWGPTADPAAIHRYSILAPVWTWLRWRRYKGLASPRENVRYRELTDKLADLIADVGLEVTDETRHEAIAGVTQLTGHLPHDQSHLLGFTWQDCASWWIDPPAWIYRSTATQRLSG